MADAGRPTLRVDRAEGQAFHVGSGQASQTVAWQATTFALVAGLIGVPSVSRATAGLAAAGPATRGRPGPVVPPLPVVAIAPGTRLAVNLVAAGPGWLAARTRPAVHARSRVAAKRSGGCR